MSRYIIRGKKFLLSLSGRSSGCGRDRRLYWMAGNRQRRTWWGLLIIDPKRLESAWAAMSLKEGGIIRQEATPFSASHKTFQTIQVTLAQEPPPRWRHLHESADRCCPCNVMQGLPGHSSRLKGPRSIYWGGAGTEDVVRVIRDRETGCVENTVND